MKSLGLARGWITRKISRRTSSSVRCGIVLLAIVGTTSPWLLRSAPVAIQWEGTITDVISFAQNPAPPGIVAGVPVSGLLIYDITESSSSGLIYASNTNGMRFRFGHSFTQTIAAAGHQWHIGGGSLSFGASVWGDSESIDAFSTSERDRHVSFPNFVGHFECGFALFDNAPPLTLFDVEPNFDIDLDQVTSASGFLTTRRWENGNIVAGYYITFVIDEASRAEVPNYQIRARANSVKKGSTHGSGFYPWGNRVLLRVKPKRGSRFLYWTENGTRLGRQRFLSFTSELPRNVVAHFK